MIDLDELSCPPFPIEPSQENIARAREFALEAWQERHDWLAAQWKKEVGSDWTRPRPVDLTGSCKFTSMFAAVVFGGHIEGNYEHQYAVVNNVILDLNEDASDVVGNPEAHEHDPDFFFSPDHIQSLESCLPRVRNWLQRFAQTLEDEPRPAL